jgi:hypothetical protein
MKKEELSELIKLLFDLIYAEKLKMSSLVKEYYIQSIPV